MCDQLVSNGHQDAVRLTEWKEDLNTLWEGLLELLNTRREVKFQSYRKHPKNTEFNHCVAIFNNTQGSNSGVFGFFRYEK